MTHNPFANVFLIRSARVVEQLRAAGFTNASYVMGGMSAWASRGWPMVKPQ
jgi:rhodanese-related sulfurtransferase